MFALCSDDSCRLEVVLWLWPSPATVQMHSGKYVDCLCHIVIAHSNNVYYFDYLLFFFFFDFVLPSATCNWHLCFESAIVLNHQFSYYKFIAFYFVTVTALSSFCHRSLCSCSVLTLLLKFFFHFFHLWNLIRESHVVFA